MVPYIIWTSILYHLSKLGDSDIIHNKNIKFLGVILDPHLTFKNHMTSKYKKALYNLSLIYMIRNRPAQIVMCSLVLTHLDYSNEILVNSPDEITKQF